MAHAAKNLQSPAHVDRKRLDHFFETVRQIDLTIEKVNQNFLRRAALDSTFKARGQSAGLQSLKHSLVSNKRRLRDQLTSGAWLRGVGRLASRAVGGTLPGIHTLPHSRVSNDYLEVAPFANVVSLGASQTGTGNPPMNNLRRKRRGVQSACAGGPAGKHKPATADTRADSRAPVSVSRGLSKKRRPIFSGKTHFPPRKTSAKLTHVGRAVAHRKRVQSAAQKLAARPRPPKPHTSNALIRKGRSTGIVQELLSMYTKASSGYAAPQSVATRKTVASIKQLQSEEVVDLSAWKFRPRVNFVEKNKLLLSGNLKTPATLSDSQPQTGVSDFQINVHNLSNSVGHPLPGIDLSERLFDFPSNMDAPSKIEISKFPSGFSVNDFVEPPADSGPAPLKQLGAFSCSSKITRAEVSNFNDFGHMFAQSKQQRQLKENVNA